VSDQAYDDLSSARDVDAIMSADAGAVIIDFWSSEAGPSEAVADFCAVAHDFADRPVRFCKVQTDAHPELLETFRIESVPTVLFALDGEILDAAVGRMDRERLRKKVRWLLSKQRGDGFFSRLFGR
jgi:thioredoxin-like negative regulator of GroEL